MLNYYELNRYPRYAITGFASMRSTLVRTDLLSEVQAQMSPWLAQSNIQGSIDLLFRFFTSDQEFLPAMGFQRVERNKDEPENIYTLVYLAPSLDVEWKKAMDRSREYPLRTDNWERFDVHRKGNELHEPSVQRQWKWAFYLRTLFYAIENHIEHWPDIVDSEWQILLHIADQDVVELPASRRHVDEKDMVPVLVPLTEEMQDAFDAYCCLDVNNRVVPAHVEAAVLLRLWRANHPYWLRHIAFPPDTVFSK